MFDDLDGRLESPLKAQMIAAVYDPRRTMSVWLYSEVGGVYSDGNGSCG